MKSAETQGFMMILSSPSGAGKTPLTKLLEKNFNGKLVTRGTEMYLEGDKNEVNRMKAVIPCKIG